MFYKASQDPSLIKKVWQQIQCTVIINYFKYVLLLIRIKECVGIV